MVGAGVNDNLRCVRLDSKSSLGMLQLSCLSRRSRFVTFLRGLRSQLRIGMHALVI